MHVVDELLAAIPEQQPPPVTWGQVIETSPNLRVRFAGDTADVRVAMQNSAVAFATGDKVCLMRVGGQWVAAFKLGAAA